MHKNIRLNYIDLYRIENQRNKSAFIQYILKGIENNSIEYSIIRNNR